MKKILFTIVTFTLLAGYASAQKGNNQLSVGVQGEFFLGDFANYYNAGIGGSVKGLYGVGSSGQLSLSTGYTTFTGKGLANGQTFSIIPTLLGYRFNCKSGFYLEPQAGVTFNTTHFGNGTYSGTDSMTEFGGALNVGYTVSGFDFSVHYLSEGDVFSLMGVKVAYNFSLGGKK